MKKKYRFFIEQYLELEAVELENKLSSDGEIAKYWESVNEMFLRDHPYMSTEDYEIFELDEQKRQLLHLHATIRVVWEQYRPILIDFMGRYKDRLRLKGVEKTISTDESSPCYEYRELYQMAPDYFSESLHDINLNFQVSFNHGNPYFFKDIMSHTAGFISFLEELPLGILARCERKKCRRIIVLTRSDKKFCEGCAVKHRQDTLWKENREEMREKEKKRYKEKRKKN